MARMLSSVLQPDSWPATQCDSVPSKSGTVTAYPCAASDSTSAVSACACCALSWPGSPPWSV